MEAKEIDRTEEENVKIIQSIFGANVSEQNIKFALLQCRNNLDGAVNEILESPCLLSPDFCVKKTVTSTGACVSALIKPENVEEPEEFKALLVLKSEERENEIPEVGSECKDSVRENVTNKLPFDDFAKATSTKDSKAIVKMKEEPDVGRTGIRSSEPVVTGDMSFEETFNLQIKEESTDEKSILMFENKVVVKEEMKEPMMVRPSASSPASIQKASMYDRLKSSNVKKHDVEDNRALSTIVIDDDDFPEEPDWLLVGKTTISGLSTTRGRKLENNEIVHLAFPCGDSKSRCNAPFVRSKAAAAASSIVRFSTTRSGEIGRLPMEWAKCLIPLVNSSKVKVLCRCIAAPSNLQLARDIVVCKLLYSPFSFHRG